MSRSEKLKQLAALDAAKAKKRLVYSAIGLFICVGILFQLNRTDPPPVEKTMQEQQSHIDVRSMMPVFEEDVLKEIKDSTDSERVILEPQPFAVAAYNSVALLERFVYLLGEPKFDFIDGAANPDNYRCQIFRARGEILNAKSVTRVVGEDAEYWTLIKTEDGDLMFFAALQVPETLFGADNFVLADGYFYKNYRQKIDGEWLTAPLFVGNRLLPSVPAASATHTPNMRLLNGVKDHPLGTDNNPLQLDKNREMWHLANVAREMRRNPDLAAEANKEAILLDFAVLTELAENPELYRGRVFELGGEVVEAHTGRIGENPLRSREISSAWVRNSFLGDTLIHIKAADNFVFDKYRGNTIFHGYFLMLWAYSDMKSIPRRVPVFVVYDSREQQTVMPTGTNSLIYGFLSAIVILSIIIMVHVKRDNKKRRAAMEALYLRKRKRKLREQDNNQA
ncbi:MAG: hypothetical protein H8E25_04215 [Planctomycetes bacterium]|nr:hypothetical protein [Planctomycetota bacterium]